MSIESTPAQKNVNWSQLLWLLALAALLGYLGWLGRALLDDQSAEVQPLPLTAPCQLPEQSCQAALESRSIHFAIDTERLSSGNPVDLRVRLDGFASERVEVVLQGRDMFMGENRYRLQPQPDGSFTTHAQLPACTTELMVWQAQVLVYEDRSIQGATFEFEAR